MTSDIIYRLIDELEAWQISKSKVEESKKLDSLIRPAKIELLQGCILNGKIHLKMDKYLCTLIGYHHTRREPEEEAFISNYLKHNVTSEDCLLLEGTQINEYGLLRPTIDLLSSRIHVCFNDDADLLSQLMALQRHPGYGRTALRRLRRNNEQELRIHRRRDDVFAASIQTHLEIYHHAFQIVGADHIKTTNLQDKLASRGIATNVLLFERREPEHASRTIL